MAKVLIVDDEIEIRETYQDGLEVDGHTVRGVGSLTHALALLPTFLPDIVLLDMQLQISSGEALLLLVGKYPQLKHTRVIIVSGYPERAKRAAEQWGAADWLGKPVPINDLRALVTQHVEAQENDRKSS
jgi:DNA-binding response OmpR family regulator